MSGERRVSDGVARAICDYKYGSEGEPGSEARRLAADLLDSRATEARLRGLLRECADEIERCYEAIGRHAILEHDDDGGLIAQVKTELREGS